MVIGRKGSGKTAIFFQVRDRIRQRRQNVVLDLKPDGYQLLKFKESILSLLAQGTYEHTITAFWEYLILLELVTNYSQMTKCSIRATVASISPTESLRMYTRRTNTSLKVTSRSECPN